MVRRGEFTVNRLTHPTHMALDLEDYTTTLLHLLLEDSVDPACQAETVLWVVALEITVVLAQLNHLRLPKASVAVLLEDLMTHSVVDLHIKAKTSNTTVQPKPLKQVQVMI